MVVGTSFLSLTGPTQLTSVLVLAHMASNEAWSPESAVSTSTPSMPRSVLFQRRIIIASYTMADGYLPPQTKYAGIVHKAFGKKV